MNLLPDYLINYMPEIEEVIEELRLSVLDHAYEMLKALDIDELTSDEIRQKLEVYSATFDNMTGDWLPNGRFYRVYPYIKHHRSRYNAIKAVIRSGGKFEGLWSNDFASKPEYNFNSIQLARHYDMRSDADGYFFISGNTTRNANGRVIGSASMALSTDILINQTLPAGYTYLYVPWPRPVYPGDSGYFYNVHMLAFDRLHYAEDCDHKWDLVYTSSDGKYSIYKCVDNSTLLRYCKVLRDETDYDKKYLYSEALNNTCDDLDNYSRSFNYLLGISSVEYGDVPFSYSYYDYESPASTKYDWQTGKTTPWRTPYWFDYHFMNKMDKGFIPNNNYVYTWPTPEAGEYYDEYGDETFDVDEAVEYRLKSSCAELFDSDAVFPTKCRQHESLLSTKPNRLQRYVPRNLVLTIHNLPSYARETPRNVRFRNGLAHLMGYNRYEELLDNRLHIECSFINAVDSNNKKIISVSLLGDYKTYNGSIRLKYRYITDEEWVTISVSVLSGVCTVNNLNNKVKEVHAYDLRSFVITDDIADKFVDFVNKGGFTDVNYTISYKTSQSIDTNDLDDNLAFNVNNGVYRNDLLYKGYMSKVALGIHHVKSYKPFFCENTPWYEMLGSNRQDSNRHTLFNWVSLYSAENRPEIHLNEAPNSNNEEENDDSENTEIEQPISERTFTSFERPTRSRLDPVYIGYLSNDINSQDDNFIINNNSVYIYDEDPESSVGHNPTAITYDPNYYYTIISLNYNENNQQKSLKNHLWYEYENKQDRLRRTDHILADFIGNPATGELKVITKTNQDHHIGGYNYITFKKSKTHKLWFNSRHINANLKSKGNQLYNFYGNSEIYKYTENTVGFRYTILEVYDESNKPLNYKSGILRCYSDGYSYIVEANNLTNDDDVLISTAAYILFRVDVGPGSVEVEEAGSFDTTLNYGMAIDCCETADIGYAEYHDPNNT